MKKFLSYLLRFSYVMIVISAAIWSILIVFYAPIFSHSLRSLIASGLGVIFLCSLIRPRLFVVPALAGLLVVIYLWATITPTNKGDWQTDVAQLAWVEQNGDDLTFHNVRDFHYRTELDYDARYSTKQVKLSQLTSVDLFASYWDGKDLAHIIMSFGFNDHDYIAVSIEARKTKQQSYSTTDGFFRNFHLIYVVAEERDLIALRTLYREPHEEVHILRGRFNRKRNTKLLLTYISKINKLRNSPAFYNTLTTNCTTQVLANAQVGNPYLQYDWRIFLSGHTPEYLYSRGSLDNTLPLDEIMERGLVNKKNQDVSSAEEFSANIREGVPRPPPVPE